MRLYHVFLLSSVLISVPVCGDGFGYRKGPLDLSHLREATDRCSSRGLKKLMSASLPTRWDSREHGWVTPVRDQGSYGACWAFATMACLETAYLKCCVVTNDFSENHLANHDVGFLWGFNDGGNLQMSTALLASWRDPIDDADDPYPNPGLKVVRPPRCHVQNVEWVPGRADVSDNDGMKRAVMEYGALMVSYYHSSGYFNDSNGAYYCPKSKGGNHAVTLVGWDDDYPAANFKITPSGDGAFLIKNSWGTASGTNGYTWVSYHDRSFGFEDALAFGLPEGTDNYGAVYEYDPCGAVDCYGYGAGRDSWCANVFTAVSTGVVEAVGCYSLCPGTSYRLAVYVGCEPDDPCSGTLAAESEGVFSTAGYKTVKFPSGAPVATPGSRFSVVAKFNCADFDYPIAVEYAYPEYCAATASAGQSFISENGIDWEDIHDTEPTANFCLKAYTKYVETPEEMARITVSVEAADGTTSVVYPAVGEYGFPLGESLLFTAASFASKTNGYGDECVRYPIVGSTSVSFEVVGDTNVIWRYSSVPSECRLRTFCWFDEYFLYDETDGWYYDTFLVSDVWMPYGTNFTLRLSDDASLGDEHRWSGWYKLELDSYRDYYGVFDFKLYGVEFSPLGDYGSPMWCEEDHYAMPTSVPVSLDDALDICWYYTPIDDYLKGSDIPYWWFMRNLYGPLSEGIIGEEDVSDAGDPDGDGFGNLDEYLADRRPLDDSSFPFAFSSITPSGLVFIGSLKGEFEVLGSEDLVNWTSVWSSGSSPRTSVTNVVPVVHTGINGFYKAIHHQP